MIYFNEMVTIKDNGNISKFVLVNRIEIIEDFVDMLT